MLNKYQNIDHYNEAIYYLSLALLDNLLKTSKFISKSKLELTVITVLVLSAKFKAINILEPNLARYTSFEGIVDIDETDIKRTEVEILKNINYKKLDQYPDKLIIDEATLFSSAELHILSQWAQKNKISLLLIGDENQNGNNQSGQNLAPEFQFAFRTPRLSISLRQGNYWKYVNQKPLEQMMDSLRGADSTEQVKLVGKQLLENDFKNFQNGTQ